MGKSLIIKGADFSENGVYKTVENWFLLLGTQYGHLKSSSPTNNSGAAAWSFSDGNNALIQGKTINQIRFYPADAGVFKIFVLDSRTSALGDPVATITVASGDVGNFTKYEFSDIQVGDNQYLAFVDPSQTVRMYYAVRSGESFYKRCGFNDSSVVSGYQLLIDVGYKGIIIE